MRTSWLRTVLVVGSVGAALAVAGCSGSQRADDDPTTSEGDVSTTTTDADASTSSAAATSSSSTSTSAAPPTTTAVGPLSLTAVGVGPHEFGASDDDVVAALVAELGAPVDDRTEPALSSSYGVCPGGQVRVVEWGGFVVLFSDGATPYAPGGSMTFFDWQLRNLGAATPPLETTAGIALGDSVAALRAAYPDVTIGDDEILGPSFRVGSAADALRGGLTATGADGAVVALAAGSSCGE